MKIYCHKCKKFLGEIRDATLRKGIKHLCAGCAAPQYEYDFVEELKKAVGV